MLNAWQRFCRTTARDPRKVAIQCPAERISFGELHDEAVRFANRLDALSAPASQPVLIVAENSPQVAAAVMGVWATGGIVALLDVQATKTHLQHAIATVTPRCVINGGTEPLDVDSQVVPCLQVAESSSVSQSGGSVTSTALPTDPASIVFTSGSTGGPKGATQTHQNLIAGCETVAGYLEITERDRVLCPVPWSFDYGFMQLQSMAFLGTTLLLPSSSSARDICEAVEEFRPTVLPGTPSVQALLMQGLSPIRKTNIDSIRCVTNTGGAIPKPVLDAMLDVYAEQKIHLNYGMTESYRSSCLPPELVKERPDSVGLPIPGVEVSVVREDGSFAGPGETGELVHRGSFVFRGYWGNPMATSKVLRPDPGAIEGDPRPSLALFTGDMGYKCEQGLLYFQGRQDHLLKPMGVRVNPGEIEALLHESGLVREVAVFGKDHALLYHEVWAAVVPHAEQAGDIAARLNQFARESMSPFMMPRRYLVKNGDLPRTSSGKTDYVALRKESES